MVDYRFVSRDEYDRLQAEGGLLESANVYGNWYGVPREPVDEALERGEDAIIKVDVQGAETIRRAAPEAVCIFLVAPSPEELVARLTRRLTESPADLELRLKTATAEMRRAPEFDHVVVNEEVDAAVEAIKVIITAEKCRVAPRRASPT
jgi:guanylate kinase